MQTQAILCLNSMSERGGSDIERLPVSKLNEERPKIYWWWRHSNSESFYVGPLSDIDLKNKMVWVWTTLNSENILQITCIFEDCVKSITLAWNWFSFWENIWSNFEAVLVCDSLSNAEKLRHNYVIFKDSSARSPFHFRNKCRKESDPAYIDAVIEWWILDWLQIDWRWCHLNSESLYVGSASFRPWFQKINDMDLNHP